MTPETRATFEFLSKQLEEDKFAPSAIIVEVRSDFFSALADLLESQPGAAPYRVGELPFFEEENLVVLIPRIGSFSPKTISLKDFLDHLKPTLLCMEMERFLISKKESRWEINKDTFDKYFEIKIRDNVFSLSKVLYNSNMVLDIHDA